MFRTNLRLVLWGALCCWAAAASAADPWQNARIMPKSDQVLLRCGREITGDAYQIAWPAAVERIEGQWLRVTDQGGYCVPPVSGWVRKDDVLKLNQANSYYTHLLQTADSPWIHWLVGICLEEQKESATAQEEFLKALDAVPGDSDGVWMAVQANPNLLDAAVRLERLKVAGTKSSDEAVAAANRIQGLAEAAQINGVRRPQAIFEQAEALQKAFRLKLSEERKKIHGIDQQIARANLEIDGGSAEDRDLFKLADGVYQLTASADPDYARTGPHRWKGSMGRAELYLTRVASLNDEAWSLIGCDAAPAPVAASEDASTSRLGATMMPIDLKKLDAFCRRCRAPEQRLATASRAHAVGVCLAVEIQLLRTAIKCFDETVRLSPDLVEAFRDRGLAYLALARCEATLAAVEEADPDVRKELAGLDPEGTFAPQKLDRALVDGRKRFDDALETLVAAKAKEALIAAEKLEITAAADQLAKNCVTAAAKHGGPEGKAKKGAEAAAQPESSLLTAWEKIVQLRIDAAKLAGQLGQEEEKAKEDLLNASLTLDESDSMLQKSEYLQQAKRSARTACEKGNFASAESLKILAEIYASQCNFDRAEFYQKLAVIFGSEDERPQLLQTVHTYRSMDDLITEKAKAKTPPSPAGHGKGSQPSGGGPSGEDSSD